MTKVFLSGSRHVSRLNKDVRQRMDNMIENGLSIVIGDANGADRAMQAHLAERQYRNVIVYFVGEAPRNNVGGWSERRVEGDPNLSGRDHYAQKDKHMSRLCDFGFVLWDGKSPGSVQNMFWLAAEGKKAVVYLVPEHHFHCLKTPDDVVDLLLKRDDDVLDELDKKIELPASLKRANRRQHLLDLQ